MSAGINSRTPLVKGKDGKYYAHVLSGLPFPWDAFTVDRSGLTTDVYNYTMNAIPAGTVTITYTDTTKCLIAGGSIVIL